MFYSKKLSQFRNLSHCFFSKKNGVSEGIYKSLNCGIGSNDKKENVKKNLFLVSKKMGVEKSDLILMHQTHSNNVIVVDEKNKKNEKLVTDALVTDLEGIALAVLTADCVPIILYDKKNNIIGCIHAGWKGALSGVIENTIKKFKELKKDNQIIASVGPCIGKESYEVGEEFYQTFVSKSDFNNKFFAKTNNDKFFFDLRGFVIGILSENGVLEVDGIDLDTFEESDNFFSYRRSQKLGELDYGRCISSISLIKS